MTGDMLAALRAMLAKLTKYPCSGIANIDSIARNVCLQEDWVCGMTAQTPTNELLKEAVVADLGSLLSKFAAICYKR